ncbi:hypothetical protein FKM82_003482 [Ascaphus truei]
MNTASDPEMDSEEADGLRDIACEEKMADLPMSHSPPAHVKEERSLKPILHLAFASPAQSELDKSTQVDIDKMLSVCAAHLVPPLSPHSL